MIRLFTSKLLLLFIVYLLDYVRMYEVLFSIYDIVFVLFQEDVFFI